jgi:hypothetical protein
VSVREGIKALFGVRRGFDKIEEEAEGQGRVSANVGAVLKVR